MKLFGSMLLLIAMGNVAFALDIAPPAAPEINPTTAFTALAMVSGIAIVARGRRKK
jgi:hypothetical protein